jgi:hypothetical protein
MPAMTLKNAALLGLIGTILITALLVWDFVFNVLNVLRGLIPATMLFSSFIYAFACFSVAVFFYVFHKAKAWSGELLKVSSLRAGLDSALVKDFPSSASPCIATRQGFPPLREPSYYSGTCATPDVWQSRGTISGSVRNTATLLEVLVATKMAPLSGLDPASAWLAHRCLEIFVLGFRRGG